MTAYLVTYGQEDIVDIYPVEIADNHNWSDGPYADTIPFAVGSNQTIVTEEEGIELLKGLN